MIRKGRPGRWLGWCLGAEKDGRNRRASRRFAAMSRPAQIVRLEGDRFVTASASLKDVSLSGLSALADVSFAESSTVWVSLNDHPAGRWVKAVVVDVKRVRGLLTYRKSPYLIRMRFGLGCPYTFFRAAVGGGPGLETGPGRAPA